MGVLFNPSGRIDRLQFWSGFLFLLMIGAALAVTQKRVPEAFDTILLGAIISKFCFYCVFAQRFRDRGLRGAFAFIPLGLGVVCALIAASAALTAQYVPIFQEIAAERGHPAETLVDLEQAMRADPGIEEAAQRRVGEPDVVRATVRGLAAPSFLAFWAVAFASSFWAVGAPRPRPSS